LKELELSQTAVGIQAHKLAGKRWTWVDKMEQMILMTTWELVLWEWEMLSVRRSAWVQMREQQHIFSSRRISLQHWQQPRREEENN
jgi:hypothetical protein